jgi:hypothetical protein
MRIRTSELAAEQRVADEREALAVAALSCAC